MGTSARLEVGRIARAHGLRGQVVVELVTNRPERVAAGSRLWAADRPLEVLGSSVLGASGGRVRYLVAFAGVGDRPTADVLRGVVLTAEPLDDPDELWVHELIGSSVVDETSAALGEVVAVQANPASDLLVLDGGGLIPLRFVTGRSPGVVIVDLPPGLLEL